MEIFKILIIALVFSALLNIGLILYILYLRKVLAKKENCLRHWRMKTL